MRGITKRFPGVVANDGVDFEAPRARSTRCSARTAPARARSRTSSPGSTAPTRARSCSTASRSSSTRRATRSTPGSAWCTSTSGSSSRSPSPRTSSSATTATSAARSVLHPRAIERRVAELGERYGIARRPARADLAALGRRAAAGRDPQGALPRGADPDPRRADRGADAAGGRGAVRDAARDGGRGADGDLHLAQAARGDGRRGPRHRAARRPHGRHGRDRRRDARSRSPR